MVPNFFGFRTTERVQGSQVYLTLAIRDVAQSGSVLRSGRRGRWFESSHPDQMGLNDS